MLRSDSISNVSAALVKAQAEFTAVLRSAENPHFRAKYAPLEDIVSMAQPILAKHELAVVQTFPPSGSGSLPLHIETLLLHSSGEFLGGELVLPLDKNTPQGVGSAITYGRRYAMAALLRIVSDLDDDAEGATERNAKRPKASDKPQSSGVEDYL